MLVDIQAVAILLQASPSLHPTLLRPPRLTQTIRTSSTEAWAVVLLRNRDHGALLPIHIALGASRRSGKRSVGAAAERPARQRRRATGA